MRKLLEELSKEKLTCGRESYSKVCSRILCFAEAGYNAESIEMINHFKFKYKRKPTFVDELNKI